MSKIEIATIYLTHLVNGSTEKIIDLFEENAVVDSPIYGQKKADKFYRELNNDTFSSEIELKGIFEENSSNNLALYFSYKWTLKNNEKAEFDVVDIIEFNSLNKIKKLKIIYDTFQTRKLVEKMKG